MTSRRGYSIMALLIAVTAGSCLLSSCGTSRRAPVMTGRVIPDKKPHRDSSGDPLDAGLLAQKIVEEARRWIGTRYVYGGQSHDGVDCSGLVMEVYLRACGIKLPRTTVTQRDYAAVIDRDRLEPGDLVFFTSKSNARRISHVGLYIGRGEMIHASSSRGVIVSRLSDEYYRRHYHSSGRVLSATGQQAAPALVSPPPVMESTEPIDIDSGKLLDDILTNTLDSIFSAPVAAPFSE